MRFIDAIYRRFAEEFAGMIACTKCPFPTAIAGSSKALAVASPLLFPPCKSGRGAPG
jgi:hypothetical protein